MSTNPVVNDGPYGSHASEYEAQPGDGYLKATVLCSGSSGNSVLIESCRTHILVDAGIGKACLAECLKTLGRIPRELSGILITHEHRDHVSGITWLATQLGIPIYATEGTWHGDAKGPLGKISERVAKNIISPGKTFMVGDITVKPFSTSHDAGQPCGYRFNLGDRSIGIATDLGYVSDIVKDELKGSNLLVFEANHDYNMLLAGNYPWFLKKRILGKKGHLSNRDAAAALLEILSQETKAIVLAHLSEENNTPELAYNTVMETLSESHVVAMGGIKLHVANRYGITGPFVV
jgi:phosphoribosyl 1,2-cyclic phosphodiesterase